MKIFNPQLVFKDKKSCSFRKSWRDGMRWNIWKRRYKDWKWR